MRVFATFTEDFGQSSLPFTYGTNCLLRKFPVSHIPSLQQIGSRVLAESFPPDPIYFFVRPYTYIIHWSNLLFQDGVSPPLAFIVTVPHFPQQTRDLRTVINLDQDSELDQNIQMWLSFFHKVRLLLLNRWKSLKFFHVRLLLCLTFPLSLTNGIGPNNLICAAAAAAAFLYLH